MPSFSATPPGLDSTAPGFRPWWERATVVELWEGIRRLKGTLAFCRGRAADLRPHLAEHIRKLERYAATGRYE